MLIFQVRLLIILTRINPKILLQAVFEQNIDISMMTFLYRKITFRITVELDWTKTRLHRIFLLKLNSWNQ